MNDEYLTYEKIASAMPECLTWTEAALIAVSRQTDSPLRFIRVGNRKSPAMWRRDDLIAWFGRMYGRNAPKLAAAFASSLQSPKSQTTAKHKTKGGDSR